MGEVDAGLLTHIPVGPWHFQRIECGRKWLTEAQETLMARVGGDEMRLTTAMAAVGLQWATVCVKRTGSQMGFSWMTYTRGDRLSLSYSLAGVMKGIAVEAGWMSDNAVTMEWVNVRQGEKNAKRDGKKESRASDMVPLSCGSSKFGSKCGVCRLTRMD